jgi:hypothetical protein
MQKAQALRLPRRRFGCGVEQLERRDCPAALSIANVALSEGTNASPVARFVVSLSKPATTAVTVNWATADGTATVAGDDYRASSGTLVFARGQLSKTVSVYVRGDATVEQDESFGVVLSNAVGATIDKATATATIRNDDAVQVVIPSLSIGDTQLLERNRGRSEARFTVTLSQATSIPVAVRCATINGTATVADGDYVATSVRLVFAPGETSKTVAVSVPGDTRIESDETFGLVLTGPTGASIAKSTGIATILNDDLAPRPQAVVSVESTAVVEGNGGSEPPVFASFTVKLSRTADSAVAVAYRTVDGTTSGVLNFSVGETTKTILIPVIGDTNAESDETFSLVLVSATGALFDRTPVKATIVDDDTPAEVRVVGVGVTEGNTGFATESFVISLNRPSDQPLVVTYATRDGTATVADSDYVAVSGSVTFAPGETEKTIPVSVVGDTRAEANETFFLDLSSADRAAILEGTGTATILNDDAGEASGFQITVEYTGTVRQSIRDACDWAAQRWSQVITGDLPDVFDSQRGVSVDDLRITVQEGLLRGGNGSGGALANAGPVAFRPGIAGLPWDAVAGIDPYDASDPQLRNIVLHEFGHALGFGISGDGLPNFYSRFVVGDGFTGSNALQAYRSLFGNSATAVPLETGGGAGTVGAHWRESVLRTELMTGYSEAPGVTMALSSITVGAMQDMGYVVNPAAADPYTAPGQSSPQGQQLSRFEVAALAVLSTGKAASWSGEWTATRSAVTVATPTLTGPSSTNRPAVISATEDQGASSRALAFSRVSSLGERPFVGGADRGGRAAPVSALAWRTLRPA